MAAEAALGPACDGCTASLVHETGGLFSQWTRRCLFAFFPDRFNDGFSKDIQGDIGPFQVAQNLQGPFSKVCSLDALF